MVARSAAVEQTVSGSLAVTALKRLRSLLAGDAGGVTVQGRFYRDEQGRILCRLALGGTLELECQLCLQRLEWTLARENTLQMVPSEEAAEQVDEAFDVCIAPEGRLDPRAMVEDEAILSLPIAPRHENRSACSYQPLPAPPEEERRPGPFEALGRLKDK